MPAAESRRATRCTVQRLRGSSVCAGRHERRHLHGTRNGGREPHLLGGYRLGSDAEMLERVRRRLQCGTNALIHVVVAILSKTTDKRDILLGLGERLVAL